MILLFCLGIISLLQRFAIADIPDTHYTVLGLKEKHESHFWSYLGEEDGPTKWSENFPNCAGKMQSPIRIDKTQAKRTKLEAIRFNGYDVHRSGMTIENNGHSLELHLRESEEDRPYIDLGGLGARYTFSQLHFHWGRNDSEGSEHFLNPHYGRSLEAHFVHVNANEAKGGRAEIAVVGLMFQASSQNNVQYVPILDVIKHIPFMNQKMDMPGSYTLDTWLPDRYHRKHFFRYNGSLTTPPCTEGVIWSIFEDPILIGRSQMEVFRKIYKTPEENRFPESMAQNNRPIQDLNGRVILRVHGVEQTLLSFIRSRLE